MLEKLPEAGYMRLPQIIGKPDADPPIVGILPISKSSWWAGVKSGRYPKSVKLGPRTTAWRVEDIRALIGRLDSRADSAPIQDLLRSSRVHGAPK